MRVRLRPLSPSLLALFVWGASAPLVAVTCVPSAPCAGLMEECPLAGAKAATGPAIAPPDCFEHSVRESEPATIPGAKLEVLAIGDAPVAVVSLPPAPRRVWHRRFDEPAAANAVPLYTLHSILLI